MESIGQRLSRLRLSKVGSTGKKLGLRPLAKVAGVSVETYRQWEMNPDAKIPDKAVVGLAKYHGVTPVYIRFGGDLADRPTLDTQALELALTMFDVVQSALGASVPPAKRALVLRQLYERAAAGTLDRHTAEDIISLAL